MSRVMGYLAEPETAVVFDIDGVLAPYEFGDLCHSACPDEEWESFVREHDPYAHIRPVRLIQGFVAAKDPSRVFACSVAEDYEEAGKRDFVTRNYAIPPENVRIVSSKGEKVAFLRQVAERLGLPERRVALVEDTVKTLNLAMDAGFATVHVSSLFALGE